MAMCSLCCIYCQYVVQIHSNDTPAGGYAQLLEAGLRLCESLVGVRGACRWLAHGAPSDLAMEVWGSPVNSRGLRRLGDLVHLE